MAIEKLLIQPAMNIYLLSFSFFFFQYISSFQKRQEKSFLLKKKKKGHNWNTYNKLMRTTRKKKIKV